MPGDISPSSSEDDADNPASKSTEQPMETDSKYTRVHRFEANRLNCMIQLDTIVAVLLGYAASAA